MLREMNSTRMATGAIVEEKIRVSSVETFELRAIVTHPSVVGFMAVPSSLIGWIGDSLSGRFRILLAGWFQQGPRRRPLSFSINEETRV
jgi:hypothetical protein